MEDIEIEKVENEKKEINYFTFKKKIQDMQIISKNHCVNLDQILKVVNQQDANKYIDVQFGEPLPIKIIDINNKCFSFILEDVQGINILKEPYKYIHSDGEIYEFISLGQFKHFLKNFNNPKIECKTCGNNKLYTPNFIAFNEHKNHALNIIDSFHYKKYDNNEYAKFFEKRPSLFIKIEFETPIIFEKNFNYYFNYHNKININEKFYIYDDKNNTRENLSYEIMNNSDKICNYYGASGRGKSITLIGSLKYRRTFKLIGSLYINCKTIKSLLVKNKESTVKQILIDEIIFFIPNNYESYKSAVKLIESFHFENNYSYWELIENLLYKYQNENLKYIIAFDQYNNLQDIYFNLKKIKEFFQKYLNFKFIIFSSMNETDIREIKIKNLFEDDSSYKDEYFFEINNVCNIIDNNLNKDQKKALRKMGNSFKELIEIKNSLKIDEYFKNKKVKIGQKIISFYLSNKQEDMNKYFNFLNKEIIFVPEEVIGRVLKFTTDYSYDKEDMSKLIKEVPFRFFHIQKETQNNNNIYKIYYSYPFIREVMLDIYKNIILNYSYTGLRKTLNNKGSGLGNIFELAVVFYLTPKGEECVNIFKNFSISEKMTIHTIVKKNNEKEEKISQLITKLEINKTYIIEQEIFNGKDLDFLIIDMKNNEPIIYALQVSIFKEIIFEKQYLFNSFSKMIKILRNKFGDINIKYSNLYFGYIFDHLRAHEPNYANMLKNCNDKGWKYCFFNADQKCFYDKDNQKVDDIKKFVSAPFKDINKKIGDFPQTFKNLLFTDSNKLNYNQINQIQNFLIQEKNIKIQTLKYIKNVKNPITDEKFINIHILPEEIQMIFIKNSQLLYKSINLSTQEIFDSPYIYKDYSIYEIVS